MSVDSAMLKDFLARTPRVAPERPQVAMPPMSSASGTTAPVMARPAEAVAPERPLVAMPVAPHRPELAMPSFSAPHRPEVSMPTFAAKERAASQAQAVDVSQPRKQDTQGDLLREIRDLLRGPGEQPRPAQRDFRGSVDGVPQQRDFGYLLRR